MRNSIVKQFFVYTCKWILVYWCFLAISCSCLAESSDSLFAEGEAHVTLTNRMSFAKLIDAEEAWFLVNYPNSSIVLYGHPMEVTERVKSKHEKRGVAVDGNDMYRFIVHGDTKEVVFAYRLSSETSIEFLWTNYMNHLTAAEEPSVCKVAFHDFKSVVLDMNIARTLPYLIKQLDDVRPVRIAIVEGQTRVCDLDAFEFLLHLRYAGSEARVFSGIEGTIRQPQPIRSRLDAEAARAAIRMWWTNSGLDLLKKGRLIWGEQLNPTRQP